MNNDKNELTNEELLNKILEVDTGKEEEKAEAQGVAMEEDDDEALTSEANAPEEEDDDVTEGNMDEGAETDEEVTPKEEEDRTTKMKRLLRNTLRDDDSEGGSLKDVFNDMQISQEWLKRHWSFLFIVFVCMLAFVTNRYQAQQEIIEESKLKQELNDWKYIWLTQFSELTRSSRQSFIEESLKQRGDSTLKPSKVAPFIIKVDGNNNNGTKQ